MLERKGEIGAAAVPLAGSILLLFYYLVSYLRKSWNAGSKKAAIGGINSSEQELEAPLLARESSNGVLNGEEGANDDVDCDGHVVRKKGQALHWTLCLLYNTQAVFHGTMALYHFHYDSGTDHKSKAYIDTMLGVTWILLCVDQTLHHLSAKLRNSPFQFLVFAACFGVAAVELFTSKEKLSIESVPLWDAIFLLAITCLTGWACTRSVTIKVYRHMNKEYAASMWSYFHYSWLTYVIDIGHKRPLQVEDLPDLIDDDRSASVWKRFSKLIYPNGERNIKEGEDLSVGFSVLRMSGGRLYLQAFWALLSSALSVIPALALHEVTDFMVEYDASKNSPVPFLVVLCVLALFVTQALSAHADGLMFKLGRRLGIRAKAAIISAVFRKTMSLDVGSVEAGKLQNHISVDAESVLNLMVFQMFMWSSLLRLVAYSALLFWYLGISALGGIGLLIILLPVNKVIVGKLKALQEQLMSRRDVRMTVVNEATQGIRIIKLFAWEETFLNRIFEARALEIATLRTYMFTLGCFMVTVKSSPTIVSLATFLVHTQLLGRSLSAATGFTALALFNQLRMPLSALPSTVNEFIQAQISFRRINALLSTKKHDIIEEGPNGESRRHCSDLRIGEVKIENGTFRWRVSSKTEPPTLSSINMHVRPGELACIFGPTGSGKSSILLALLQELITEQGRAVTNGSVAYVSQRAWIQNATLRDNILFGCPWDPVRYDQVLEACALKPDLTLLEAEDLTEIGEKGVNLSGGQQSRLSLARAVYCDADIYLLDDVLSAVDAHVGQHIFENCIRGMLKGKTVILVTHQVGMVAKYADRTTILAVDGTVKATHIGAQQEDIIAQELAEVEKTAETRGTRSSSTDVPKKDSLQRSSSTGSTDTDKSGHKQAVDQKNVSANGSDGLNGHASGDKNSGKDGGKEKETDKGKASRGQIIVEEALAQSNPKPALYLAYFEHCGGVWFAVWWILLSMLWQALTVAQSFVLREWINEMAVGNNNGPGLWRYIGVSAGSFVALLLRTLLITGGSVQASKRVHNAMAVRLFGAPMSWFDSTPLGRIFNRFSSDIVTLDKDLMNDISSYTDTLLSVAGVVAVITVAIPLLTLAMVPVLILCWWYAYIYLQSSRQLKRLEAVNRSPIYAQFGESVLGVTTVRAFEAVKRFIGESEAHVDRLNRTHMYLWCTTYWLTNRVRLIGSAVCGLVGIFLVADVGRIDGSTAGLVLSYALQFTYSVVFTVRLHAQMEMSVNSIERLDEYCKVPQELPSEIPENRPPPNWPAHGEVIVRNLTLKYNSATEPVLHGLTFHVPARSKVGIVGRTGAGKSSLTNALFRIVEPQPGSVIEIDGIDIMKIGLRDLRRRLAIIPQEPTLFKGTLRSNIDPLSEYSDLRVWEALRQCHLDAFVRSCERGLDHEVSATGSNLSVGQRQLICMARALLRQARVLILDESTASVDLDTDNAIQDTLTRAFSDCTLLVIAHRLHTVVQSDLILVLEEGRVLEFAPPLPLLLNTKSAFHALCKKTGELESLVAAASRATM